MNSQAPPESDRPIHVLFLCTGNSARSIFAEALLAKLGGERFRACSAGSHPKSQPHGLTLETLDRLGYETKNLRSKSWDEFARPESPRLDFIFTVCGRAAKESCPVWPGHPTTAHWGVEDPAAFSGTLEEERAFFEKIHDELAEKIERFVELDFSCSESSSESSRDARSFAAQLSEIGED